MARTRRSWVAAVVVGVVLVTSAAAGAAAGAVPATTGVTPQRVRLGVAATDNQSLKDLGVDVDGVEPRDLFAAWVAAQNRRGGVGGRKIELVFRPFVPLIPTEAQKVCVELTADMKSFLVIGIFLDDDSLCVTETHKTPYIGLWGLSAERAKRSVAPFVAMEMADDRQRLASVRAFAEEGAFRKKRVALFWNATDDPVVKKAIKPALKKAGVKLVEQARLDDYGDDDTAAEQALDTVVEKLHSADPDVVLNVSDFSPLMEAFQRKGWTPPKTLVTSAQALSKDVLTITGLEPKTLQHVEVAAPYVPPKDELVADTQLASCIDEYNASDPKERIQPASATKEALVSVADYCAAFRVFVKGAQAAGHKLTAKRWLAGVEAIGKVQLPALPIASLGPDKYSAGDAIGRYRFDAASGRFEPTGPAIDATK